MQKWSDNIPFIKTLAISAIIVALVVTPIQGDEYVAWAYFLRAILEYFKKNQALILIEYLVFLLSTFLYYSNPN